MSGALVSTGERTMSKTHFLHSRSSQSSLPFGNYNENRPGTYKEHFMEWGCMERAKGLLRKTFVRCTLQGVLESLAHACIFTAC